MAPTTANQRPARHAFNKAVRGVIGQTNGGDATMKDVPPASGPVRSRVSTRKKHTIKDAMQVEHAAKISKLASRIGPSKLSVTGRVAASKASPRLPAHEMWREFVKARYNVDAQFLDLSRLSDDAVLKKYNLAPPGLPGKTSKTGAVVFKLASQLKPPPITVSLAHNGLTSTSDFQTLSHYLPGVRNLSLEDNALKEMRDIEPFAGRRGRLTTLRELILAGNPLRETEFAAGKGDKFQNEIARRFPSLEILDGHVFIRPTAPEVDPSTSATGAAANIPVATSFPVTIQPGSVDPSVQLIVAQFCTQFFDRFDNLRADLQYVYAPEATLSFSVNTSIPPRAKVQGLHTHPSMPHQRKLEWGKWFEARSRNLSRIREPEQFAKALCTGIAEIGEGLARIPGTKHDLSQPNHFVVDASTIDSGVLMVMVHGQFTEVETQGVRSFDRTFVLAPAAFGSPAQQHGWPVQIVSDLWVIRGYSHPDVWTPGAKLLAQDEAARGATFGAQNGAGFTTSAPPAVAVPPPVAPTGPTPETIFAALPADDQALVSTVTDVARRNTLLAFCARSGLRVMFAGQCLEGNGWDPEAAWANFQTVRAQLGPESFISQ